MHTRFRTAAYASLLTLPLAACGDQSTIATGEDYGPSPKLVQPHKSLIPTVNIAKAVGWPQGAKPTPASGMAAWR